MFAPESAPRVRAVRPSIHAAQVERAAGAYPRELQGWYAISILMVITIASFLDRQLPALLVDPIRHEFRISITQFSLLQGAAFALLYSVIGIPFGRFVDVANRRNLIIFGLVVWSAMTVLCGLARSYGMLLAARSGVGIGEACLAPAAYSMIADYFAPLKRGRALAVYFTALAIGGGLSMLAGGAILGALPANGVALPWLGELPAWRVMFLVAGAPGLPLATLLLTVREPLRLSHQGRAIDANARPPQVRELMSFIFKWRSVFFRLFAVQALAGLIGYSVVGWAVVVLGRTLALPNAQAAMLLGVCVMMGGLGGALAGGFLSDLLERRAVLAARLRVTMLGTLIILPAGVVWPLAHSAPLTLFALTLTMLGGAMATGSGPATFQEIVPNQMRGQIIAVYLLIASLFGIGLGPTSVAWLASRLSAGENGLSYALASVAGVASALAVVLAATALSAYMRLRDEVARG